MRRPPTVERYETFRREPRAKSGWASVVRFLSWRQRKKGNPCQGGGSSRTPRLSAIRIGDQVTRIAELYQFEAFRDEIPSLHRVRPRC